MRYGVLFLSTILLSSFIIACAGNEEPEVVVQTKWVDKEEAHLDPGVEGAQCVNGTDSDTTSCYAGPDGTAGVGVCKAGKQWCIGNKLTACLNQVLPSVEICDGLDNDCDGEVDEGFGEISCGVGACAVSTLSACQNGKMVTDADCQFISYSLASQETCDGVDNDCDGKTDETANDGIMTKSCYSGPNGTQDMGVCHGGTATCTEGAWSSCDGEVTPTAELCDGLDNDCDEGVDETFALGAACVVGAGSCENTGTYMCNAEGDGVECSASAGVPQPETCDGLDNDCDALVDEGDDGNALWQNCYTGTAGTAGVGACTAGTSTCTDGAWAACAGEVTDSPETCDGLDNDCDNSVDEGDDGNALWQSCYTGANGTAGVGQCTAGTDVCHAGEFVGLCFGEKVNAAEVCFNGLDDDCDGSVDENCTVPCTDADGDGYGEGCSLGADCNDANAAVNAGMPEWCNNLTDDDCDGYVDESGCSSANPGSMLVRFEQTGNCVFSNLVFYHDFANIGAPKVKTYFGQSGFALSQWNFTPSGSGQTGLHRLNLEFDTDEAQGNELTYVVDGADGAVVHDECGTLRIFYSGVEVEWTALRDPRIDLTPFAEANVFVCFGDTSECFLCGGDWNDNSTPDCDEDTGQCDLHPADGVVCAP